MWKPSALLPALAVLLGILPAAGPLAATYDVASRIEIVTVQPDRAQVTRRASLEVAAGSHELVLADLPVLLDRLSLSLTTTTPGVVIGRATLRDVETSEPVGATARRLTDELRQRRLERRLEQDRIKAQELTLDVLGRAQLTVELSGETALQDPAAVFAMLESRGDAALAAIRDAEQAIDRLDAEIDRLERQLDRLGEDPMRRLEMRAPVTVADAGTIDLVIDYAVREAGFNPSLDARLDTRSETLTLTATAEVSQRTGEDWQDVTLAISTAQPRWQTAAPPAETWYVDIERDEPRPLARMQESRPMMADAGLAATAEPVIDRSGFDVAYAIEEPQTIAADSTVRRVPLVSLPLEAELVWRAVPSLDATAFLTATAIYAGEAPILPGTAQLYRDGMAVGETYQDGLQPEEEIELGFGADPAVEIELRLRTDRRAQSGLIGTTRRHERRYAIEATNRRQEPVTLEILERLPVPRDERIVVRLLDDTTPPDTRSFDDKPGILAWRRTLEAGQSLELILAYEVRHPADLDVTGF